MNDPGCQSRKTELDIQECVGIGTKYEWAKRYAYTIHSNTHDWRQKGCKRSESRGNEAELESGTVYDDYHVYGAWWKSPTEILFFLDGKYLYTITPSVDFNIELSLKMVVETYGWNPPKNGQDGMNSSYEERTAYYDWVRSYTLEEISTSIPTEVFFIVNRETGKKIRTRSNIDGDNIELVPASWAGTPTKWQKVNAENGYFHLKNVDNGMYFRPASRDNGSLLVQRPSFYKGDSTKWIEIEVSGSPNYFYLLNKATGSYFRPETGDTYSPIIQRPTTYSGTFTQWQFIPVNPTTTLGKVALKGQINEISIYPNPLDDGNLSFQIPTGKSFDISIFDQQGRVVYSAQKVDSNLKISRSILPTSGLYIIEFTSEDGVEQRKLVVE